MAGTKFASSASPCRVPHHSHRLLHPLLGLLYRHQARAVRSSGGLHFLLHVAAVTQGLGAKGLRGERAAAERGGRGPLLPGRREKARHPGAICGRTQASRISKRRLRGGTESVAAPLESTPPSSASATASARSNACGFWRAPSAAAVAAAAAALLPEIRAGLTEDTVSQPLSPRQPTPPGV